MLADQGLYTSSPFSSTKLPLAFYSKRRKHLINSLPHLFRKSSMAAEAWPATGGVDLDLLSPAYKQVDCDSIYGRGFKVA
jgi:hypothetical protein